MISFENGTINIYKKKDNIKVIFNIKKDELSTVQIELELTDDQASELISEIVTEKNK